MKVITKADSFGVQGNKTQLTLKSQVFNMLTLEDSKPPFQENKDKVKAISEMCRADGPKAHR